MTLSGYYYTASAGETFDSIALDVYGDEKFAAELMTANVDEAKKLVLTGGEVLALPSVVSAKDPMTGAEIGTAPWKE